MPAGVDPEPQGQLEGFAGQDGAPGKDYLSADDLVFLAGSGREGDWFLLGFSPRKQALTIYTMGGLQGVGGLLEKLGKIKTGGGCLYIKSLEDIDLNILRRLLTRTVTTLKNIRRT